jgi:hypothetical protein
MSASRLAKVAGILLLTLLAAIGIAGFSGLALSIALHFVDHGEFGFSWVHPTIFVGAAVVGFVVYFALFFLKLRSK